MKIWIRNRQRRISIPVRRIKTFIEQILLKLKRPDVELGLVLLNDRQIRRLNQKYRGKDTPTDVLSFSLNNASSYKGPLSPPVLLGDVVISLETARRQAQEHGHALYQEVERLVIHGILHLLGFDHEATRDARRMHRKESELIKNLRDKY
jgi:probable rRNA maturation factor